MRKLFVLILAAILLFSLVGCADNGAPEESPDPEPTPEVVEEPEPEEPDQNLEAILDALVAYRDLLTGSAPIYTWGGAAMNIDNIVSAALADFDHDGVPELVLMLDPGGSGSRHMWLLGVWRFDGSLEIIYRGEAGQPSPTGIQNFIVVTDAHGNSFLRQDFEDSAGLVSTYLMYTGFGERDGWEAMESLEITETQPLDFYWDVFPPHEAGQALLDELNRLIGVPATPPAALEESDDAGWREDYLDILRNTPGEVNRVSTVDLTGDGIPELIFSSLAENWRVSFSVYSFSGGQRNRLIHMERLETMVSAAEYDVYLTNDGTLIVRGGNGGESNFDARFYIFSDVTADPEIIRLDRTWARPWDGEYGPDTWSINDTEVSEAQYEAELNRIYQGAAYRLVFSSDFLALRSGAVDISMSLQEALSFLQG